MKTIFYKVDEFEGPLDLLLQLIAKNKMDIFDISIENLVNQYIGQIEKMNNENMEVSSEFIQMATKLIYIKTVSLLPKNEEAVKLKEELQGQLIEYHKCKQVSKLFSKLVTFDMFCRTKETVEEKPPYTNNLDLKKLCTAYANIIFSSESKITEDIIKPFATIVKRKIVSIQSKAIFLLNIMYHNEKIDYKSIFLESNTKSELVATFLALLELVKENRIAIYDNENDERNPTLKLISGGE